MSNTKQDGSELFDQKASDDSDGVTDTSASTSEDGDESTSEAEESQASKDEREKAIKAHLRKIEDGKQTLEDLQAKQPWIAEEVRKRLEGKNEPTVDIDAVVEAKLEAKLQERQEREEFKAMKERLNNISTTKDQREKITAKYEDLKDKLGDLEALKVAAEIAGVSLEDHLMVRKNMHVPSVGSGSSQSDDLQSKIMNQKNLSQDEVRAIAMKRSSRFTSSLQKK